VPVSEGKNVAAEKAGRVIYRVKKGDSCRDCQKAWHDGPCPRQIEPPEACPDPLYVIRSSSFQEIRHSEFFVSHAHGRLLPPSPCTPGSWPPGPARRWSTGSPPFREVEGHKTTAGFYPFRQLHPHFTWPRREVTVAMSPSLRPREEGVKGWISIRSSDSRVLRPATRWVMEPE